MVAAKQVELPTAHPCYFLKGITNYGVLFLGLESRVAYEDNVIGTNYTLPTRRAARYTARLWVGKFIETVMCQHNTPEASAAIGGCA